jgi:hypothetical protein
MFTGLPTSQGNTSEYFMCFFLYSILYSLFSFLVYFKLFILEEQITVRYKFMKNLFIIILQSFAEKTYAAIGSWAWGRLYEGRVALYYTG